MTAKDFMTLRLPRSRLDKVRRVEMDLARDRTAFLLARLGSAPLPDLLANAWLQGIADAVEVGTV